MAREAGFQTGKRDYADGHGAYPFVVSVSTGNFPVELKAFADLVRADEREKAKHNEEVLMNALWKACGDDGQLVEETIESQGELK
jgi:hypothetical protein